MAATVHIVSYHGVAGGTTANVESTTIRFKKADNDTADTNNRMPVPPSGTEYSYIKHLALSAATTPTALIDTCKAYGDGALPTGVQMFMRDNAYIDPTVQIDTALGSWSNNYTTYTSGAKLAIAGSIANPSTGKIYTNYLQMQAGIISTATPGIMTAETLTLEYLES